MHEDLRKVRLSMARKATELKKMQILYKTLGKLMMNIFVRDMSAKVRSFKTAGLPMLGGTSQISSSKVTI